MAKSVRCINAETLLEQLTSRQYLIPHKQIGVVLAEISDAMGLSTVAIDSTIQRLAMDTGRSIGRLRRVELETLARTLHRCQRVEFGALHDTAHSTR